MNWVIFLSTNAARTDVPSRRSPLRVRIDRDHHESSLPRLGKIFDVDNTLATAMIDRLMHHGEALVIQGESYRTKDKSEES